MAKYIKLFNTTAQYNTYMADTLNLILSNVSLAKDAPGVIYFNSLILSSEGSGSGSGSGGEIHEYVEIGGIKWATMNVGANSVTDTGLYFQWGDTQGYTAAQVGSGEGKKYFGWADYKYGNGTSSPGATGMTKYNSTDSKTVLEVSDDAARANMGGLWRMPTKDECVALGNAVNTEWTTDYQGSGVAGLVCTDKTDSSKVLFLPAAGFCSNGSMRSVGNSGSYWSSSLGNSVSLAYLMGFDRFDVIWDSSGSRCSGYLVRGVLGE